ncbi:helix-turn-helix domain-containing protein [Shewanella sp.]|uniref:helix-turn-helix domain-containing protein n=1 Tax=Shewanella sp. TaxID=50422 RepID=UPI003F2C8962
MNNENHFSELSEAVSDRIRKRAHELGVSQADVARATGAAKSSVHSWFHGTAVPRGQHLAGIRKVLKCTQDWLFEGRGSPSTLNIDHFYASLPASWELVPGDQPQSTLVKLPALNPDGSLDIDSVQVMPSAAVAMMQNANQAAWLRVTSDAASPQLKSGDIVVIDAGVRSITRSGAIYVVLAAGVLNTCRVHIEFDGSLSVYDSERNSHLKVPASQAASLPVLGHIVHRCGPV